MDTKPAVSKLVPYQTTFVRLDRLRFGHEHPEGFINIRKPTPELVRPLMESIRAEGLLQALLVTPHPEHGSEGPYYTIAGGRRLLALQMLRDAGELERLSRLFEKKTPKGFITPVEQQLELIMVALMKLEADAGV